MKNRARSKDVMIAACLLLISFFKIAKNEECGGQLRAGDMEFMTSPGYPRSLAEKGSTYTSNLDCIWSYTGQDDTLVAIKFLDTKIQPGKDNSNETCDFDYVHIKIESTGDGRRYCGFSKHPDAVVGLGSAEIHFHTDENYNFRGFRLAYKITPEYDPCEGNMCKEGECVSDDGIKARCDCQAGFTGTLCESDIEECESNPCQNEGTCDDSIMLDHYVCDCPFEYRGDNCEIAKVPECDNSPCQNGATCVDLPRFEYECQCAEFYEGKNCTEEIGCSSPGLPNVDDSKRFHRGTKLQFSCRQGFEMDGENETECLDDDSWSNDVPDCRGRPYLASVLYNRAEEHVEIHENEGEDVEEVEEPSISETFIIGMGVLGTVFLLYSVFVTLWMKYRSPWYADSVKVFENRNAEDFRSAANISAVCESQRFSNDDAASSSVKED